MCAALYAVNLARLRTDGVRLRRLASTGQFVLLITALAIPLVQYAISRQATPEIEFWNFIKDLLITGPVALVNAYALVKGLAIFLALDRTRRLGRSLSSDDPLGSNTLSELKWLGYTMCLLALVMCISIEALPADPKFKVTLSFTSLYFGVMVVTGLSIAHRIVSEAIHLKTETQEFI